MKWDKYFLDICNTVSLNSKCLSRKIGAIIVRDKSIISTGYNGPARGIPACSERYKIDKKLHVKLKDLSFNKTICPRRIMNFKSGKGMEWCVASHAERSSIINAAREGIKTKGATIYMNCPTPCTQCLIEIINSGIVEVVITEHKFYDLMSEYLITQSNLIIRTYSL